MGSVDNKRSAFFVSDRTGITAEALGRSLLTQFNGVEFTEISLSFIDSLSKAQAAVAQINQRCELDGKPALIFSTQITEEYRDLLAQSNGVFFDFFETFISKMETALSAQSSHTAGLSHGVKSNYNYLKRIESINFALNSDDGMNTKNYDRADVILLGVSRSGKTPTCLFLALQYGVNAANYPLIEQDLITEKLPKTLKAHQNKLFGLTTNPNYLNRVRSERRSDSHYATLAQCQRELRYAESVFRVNNIPFIDTGQTSIEEIAATILDRANLKRRY